MGKKPSYLQNRRSLQKCSEDLLGPERLAEVRSGHPVTEAELRVLRNQRLEKMLGDDGDADFVPAYCLAEIADADGNTGVALILCKGYSFSGVTIWVEDVFDTRAAAHPVGIKCKEALAHLFTNPAGRLCKAKECKHRPSDIQTVNTWLTRFHPEASVPYS